MREKINIPYYYTDLYKEIISPNLKEVLEEQNPLNYLRRVYRKDSTHFFDLRDELLLRGLEFNKKYQNNFLPPLNFEPENLIVVKKNYDYYKKLDLNTLPINSFNQRFNVNSDFFFNLISIEALSFFLKRKPLLVKSQFERVGFKVVKANSLILEVEDEETNKSIYEDKIEVIFEGTEFNKFREYCNINKINYLSDLNEALIKEFRNHRQVGEAKYKLVLKKIHSINGEKKETDKGEKKETEKKWNEIVNENLAYFNENPLKRILYKANTEYLEFINEIYSTDNIFASVEESTIPAALSKFKLKLKAQNESEFEFRLKRIKHKITSMNIYSNIKNLNFSSIQKVYNIEIISTGKYDTIESFIKESIIIQDLIEVYSKLKHLKNFNTQFTKIRTEIDSRNLELLILKEKNTLEELGERVGLTRERVRQIIKKTKIKVNSMSYTLNLSKLIKLEYPNSIDVEIVELGRLLDIYEDNMNILECVLKSEKNLNVLNGKVILTDITSKRDTLENVLDELESVVLSPNDLMNIINEKKLSLNYEQVQNLIFHFGYIFSNDVFVRVNSTTTEKLKYIFSEYFRQPIKLDDKGLLILRDKLTYTFGDDIPKNDRALLARVRDNKNIILVDKNTFCYFEKDYFDKSYLDELKELLDLELSYTGMVKAEQLYNKYEFSLKKMGLNSFYQMYSIFQYFFNDEYSIGRGNTMAIYSSEDTKLENKEILEDFLERNSGSATKQKIINQLKWKSYTLEQTLSRSDDVIVYYNDQISQYEVHLYKSLGITYNDKSLIMKFMRENVRNEYFFPNDIMIEMEFDTKLSEVLYKAKVTNLYNFYSFIKKIYPNLKGSMQFLYTENSEFKSISEFISNEYSMKVTRDEIENFILSKGYAEGTVTSLLLELETKYFYHYTSSSYINKNVFVNNSDLKKSIREYINEKLMNKPYISAYDLVGYSLNLQKYSTIELQPLLIASITQELGFKIIHTTKDYRYDKWLILNANLKVITNYEDLVYYMLIKKYKGNFHEKDISEFLERNMLSHTNNKISYELKSSRYFSINKIGFLTIKERNHVIERAQFKV